MLRLDFDSESQANSGSTRRTFVAIRAVLWHFLEYTTFQLRLPSFDFLCQYKHSTQARAALVWLFLDLSRSPSTSGYSAHRRPYCRKQVESKKAEVLEHLNG